MKTVCATLLMFLVTVVTAEARQKDGYILQVGDKTHISKLDLESFLVIKKSLRGDTLWVRRDGRKYEIRDKEILERAADVMQPLMAISREYDSFEVHVARPAEREEEELDRLEDNADESDFRARRDALELRLRAIEREEQRLDAKQEREEASAERKIDGLIAEAFRKGLARRID